MNATLDHLVVAGTDLSALVAWWINQTGAAPVPGRAHVGLGTRNALVGLGESSYVELISPDPMQADPAGPRPFAIDAMEPDSFRLIAVALGVKDLEHACAAIAETGLDPGEIRAMNRLRPDGVELNAEFESNGYAELGIAPKM